MTRGRSHAILFGGLLLVSTSGPFLVAAHMDAYAVVLLRMVFAAAILLLVGHRDLPKALPHLPRLVVGALLLAAHFVLWVKAFDLTDYASNLLLLVAQPVIATFLAMRLGEPANRNTWISLGLATLGLTIIAGGDFALGPRALLGDAMCILGDLAIALFYVVTRDARQGMSMPAFLGATLTFGAVSVAPLVAFTHSRLSGYSATQWSWLAALVILTTVAGHGLINTAARYVSLFELNIVIVLEPAIGILLGAMIFGAQVTALQVGGGVLLAAAVVIGLRRR